MKVFYNGEEYDGELKCNTLKLIIPKSVYKEIKLNVNNYFSFILIYEDSDRCMQILEAYTSRENAYKNRCTKMKVILKSIRITSSRKDALLKVNCNLENTPLTHETIDSKQYMRNIKIDNLLKSEKQE